MTASTVTNLDAVYAVPVGPRVLLHAPLHEVTALLSAEGARRLAGELTGDLSGAAPTVPPLPEDLAGLAAHLRSRPAQPPEPTSGPVTRPAWLGLIPTRGCTLDCGYCDFGALTAGQAELPLDLAVSAIDGYLGLLTAAGAEQAQLHFFGGEPFHAPRVVTFATGYARARARDLGIALHVEATTNGVVSLNQARWIAQNLDAAVLSLDGPRSIQDAQRPTRTGHGTFDTVLRTARVLAEGPVDLIVRTCVTAANVELLPEWARWLAGELRPSTVCLESLTPSARAGRAGHHSPDPIGFARAFGQAARILAEAGIETVQSTSDTGGCRLSACPVGSDALIVTPEGAINACYLPEDAWRGLDLHLGRVVEGRPVLDLAATQRVRDLASRRKPLCEACFARFHCAGGCHVHHRTDAGAGSYDDLCRATRLLVADRLLRRLGLPDAGTALLADERAARTLADHPDDRLAVRAIGPHTVGEGVRNLD